MAHTHTSTQFLINNVAMEYRAQQSTMTIFFFFFVFVILVDTIRMVVGGSLELVSRNSIFIGADQYVIIQTHRKREKKRIRQDYYCLRYRLKIFYMLSMLETTTRATSQAPPTHIVTIGNKLFAVYIFNMLS